MGSDVRQQNVAQMAFARRFDAGRIEYKRIAGQQEWPAGEAALAFRPFLKIVRELANGPEHRALLDLIGTLIDD
jgi:hypothetical protein